MAETRRTTRSTARRIGATWDAAPATAPNTPPEPPAVDATVALLTSLPVAAASLVASASCATAMLRRTLRVACIFRWTATGSAAAARLAFRYPFSERSPRGASLAVASVPARRRRTLRPMMTALLALKAMSSAPSSSVSLSALLLAVPMATLATWARERLASDALRLLWDGDGDAPARASLPLPALLPGAPSSARRRCRMTSGEPPSPSVDLSSAPPGGTGPPPAGLTPDGRGESPTALPRRFPA